MITKKCIQQAVGVVVLLSLPGLTLAAPPSAAAPKIVEEDWADGIVAAIEGEPITISDIVSYSRTAGVPLPSGGASTAEFKKLAREYIVSQLLEREAQATGVAVDNETIDSYIKTVQRQSGLNDDEFKKLVGARGMSIEEYRQQVQREILRSRVVASRLRAKVQVSDEDVSRYLLEHPEHVPAQGAVKLEQVSIPVLDASDLPDARARLEKFREQVEGGEAASEVAPSYTTDFGYVDIEELKDDVRDAAKDLEKGEVSGIVESESAVSFVKVLDIRSGAAEVPMEVRETIRNQLLEEKMQQAMNDTLTEELFKKYTVEMK